ncbi:myb-like protein X [Actinia tenebrosa]|uniref:Myb-like protein X n=1 Tax=Actinia tenebrosa TaxID=6105 RepID=A0A6P8IEF0_ACTTE|nr:myb-like protein X [Actinia tenebrosa]
MTETTKLPASFSNSTAFESSTAFLMVQKNNNKRQTSMTDDVFRIFRRTGKKISQIGHQIERERGVYLKESYSHKNALYKELASIPNVKEDIGRRKTKVLSHMPPLPRFADVHTSDLICRPVKSQLSRQRPGQDTELELEKRINVNVLKRCECCRRLAFRYKEMSEKMQNLAKQEKEEEEEKKQKKESRETKSAKQEETKRDAEIQKLIEEARTASPFRQSFEKSEGGSEQTRLFQYSSRKPSEARPVIDANQRVEASFRSLRRQSQAVQSQKHTPVQPRSVTTVPSPTKSERNSTRDRSWSIVFDKCSFTVPPEPSPSPLGRQKLRVKFEYPHLKEKLKVSGKDWRNHLLKLQGVRVKGKKQTVVALSKAYVAFKKLLNKMEEERKRAEEMAERSDDSEGSSRTDSPTHRNRLQSEASIVASLRWQPRRTSRINSLISPQNLHQVSLEDKDKKNSRRVGLKEDYNDGLSDCTSDVDGEGRFTVLE